MKPSHKSEAKSSLLLDSKSMLHDVSWAVINSIQPVDRIQDGVRAFPQREVVFDQGEATASCKVYLINVSAKGSMLGS